MQDFFDNLANEFLEPETKHKVYPLEFGIDSLLLRLKLIEKARKKIKIQTFLWRNDFSGNLILDKLFERAKSGIKIDLIIDHWDLLQSIESIAKKIRKFSEHENFNVKLFNPVNTENEEVNLKTYIYELPKFSLLQKRMHGKIFNVDEACCIVGGRNIGDEYFDLQLHRNFTDKEVIYSGSEMVAVNKSLDDYWTSSLSINIKDLISVENNFRDSDFKRERSNLSLFRKKRLNDLDQFTAEILYYPEDVEFVYDQPDSDLLNTDKTGNYCLEVLQKARDTIAICSALLILPKNYLNAFKKLKKKGVFISIVTNSLTSSDNLYTYTAALSQRHRLVNKITKSLHETKPIPKDISDYIPFYQDMSKQVREYGEAPKSGFGSNKFESNELHTTLHSKYIVIDQEKLLVGSMHLDMRALNINTENFFLIKDEALAKRFYSLQEKWKFNTNSWVLAPKRLNNIKKLIRFVTFLMNKFNLNKSITFNFINCFKVRDINLEEVPDISSADFYKKYESCGVYPNTLQVDQDIELFLVKQYSSLMKDLL